MAKRRHRKNNIMRQSLKHVKVQKECNRTAKSFQANLNINKEIYTLKIRLFGFINVVLCIKVIFNT